MSFAVPTSIAFRLLATDLLRAHDVRDQDEDDFVVIDLLLLVRRTGI